MNKHKSLKWGFIFISIFLISMSCEEQRVEWNGIVKTENGVEVVINPIEPLYGENIFALEKDLTIGDGKGQEYTFSWPRQVEVDDNENIYVLEFREALVKVFDKNGKFIRKIGEKGNKPGELEAPASMFINSQNEIMVEDIRKRRFLFYSLDGEYLRDLSKENLFLANICIDSKGNIIGSVPVNEPENPRYELQKFDANLNYLLTFGSAPGSDPKLYNPFRPILRGGVIKDDHVVFGYPEDYELRIFNPEGKEIKRIKKEYEPVEITPEEIEGVKEQTKDMPPSIKLEIPRYHPAYLFFVVDDEGRIFVRTREKEESGESNYYDVFDFDGKYLARIALHAKPRLWKKQKLYTIEKNEAGYFEVVRYKVFWK